MYNARIFVTILHRLKETSMRRSGILLPLSSLNGKYGIGTFGKEAFAFVDFLHAAGQSCWQILPIGPTGYGDSPYQSFSAFAGNPYFIDLDILYEKGLLTKEECIAHILPEGNVDYGILYRTRWQVLKKASARMDKTDSSYLAFCKRNAKWLDDYALFMTIKSLQDHLPLLQWPDELKNRRSQTVAELEKTHENEIAHWKILQYFFYNQFFDLKKYANTNSIDLIGDIAIYVSADSADVWAHPNLFQIDADFTQRHVAGCPPDRFSPQGQVWGNPLYDWPYHKKTKFAWWLERLAHAQKIYDITRIDHFRGLESYYSIPADETTAENGRWIKGPGKVFIDAINTSLPSMRIIAEDLGFLTPKVHELLYYSKYPGMKVLQFAFGDEAANIYLPHFYTPHSVVYTGTHDNTTAEDWQYAFPPREVAHAKNYMNYTPSASFAYSFIRLALGSVSDLAVIPLADYLCLGSEGRINTPQTLEGNWIWRVKKDALDEMLQGVIYHLTALYGRLP